jgi:hypothetical protein
MTITSDVENADEAAAKIRDNILKNFSSLQNGINNPSQTDSSANTGL